MRARSRAGVQRAVSGELMEPVGGEAQENDTEKGAGIRERMPVGQDGDHPSRAGIA